MKPEHKIKPWDKTFTRACCLMFGMDEELIYWLQIEEGLKRIRYEWPGDDWRIQNTRQLQIASRAWWDWYIGVWDRRDQSLLNSVKKNPDGGWLLTDSKGHEKEVNPVWYYHQIHRADRMRHIDTPAKVYEQSIVEKWQKKQYQFPR